MRLIQTCFKDVMELNGEIIFPEDKAVVIYGANLQGKTNVINAIRYAFLKESRKGRKKYYDEWAIPIREEVAPREGSGEVKIVFEHEGKYYKLERVIAQNKSDKPNLVQLSGWPGSVVKTIDPESFFKERLKVGLLDILFAPEIAGGFKRLYGRDVEDAIGEVFKEVISARRLAQNFNRRLERLKSGAEAKITSINSEYNKFVNQLIGICKDVESFSSFQHLKIYEAGKSHDKMEKLEEEIRVRIRTLDEAKVFQVIEKASNNAERFDRIQRILDKAEEIENYLIDLKKTKSDLSKLKRFLHVLQNLESPEDFKALQAPRFYDEQLQRAKNILIKLEDSRKSLLEAKSSAKKLGVNLKDVESIIKDVDSVISILKLRRKIKGEERASLTKIAGRVHAVIPINVLVRDPSYAKIASEPVPKGSKNERKRYLNELSNKKIVLKKILEDIDESNSLFTSVKKRDLPFLSKYSEELAGKTKNIEQEIDKWLASLVSEVSVFFEKPWRKPKIESRSGLKKFVTQTAKAVGSKKEEHLNRLNKILEPLQIHMKDFCRKEINIVLKEMKRQKTTIPKYSELVRYLNSQKEAWRNRDEEYRDYSVIPKLAENGQRIMKSIANNSVDEEKLREAIASTYTDIINRMKERKLIQAITSISKGTMKAEVTYKDRIITHPAGAEKAFFSLAILTALAHYFKMPILIDEVANNVDSKNLQAFFNLVSELKDERSVQYLLSVKETKDFEMDGWVKEIADELAIYRIEDKNITKIR